MGYATRILFEVTAIHLPCMGDDFERRMSNHTFRAVLYGILFALKSKTGQSFVLFNEAHCL